MDNTTNNTNPTPNYTNLSFLDEKQSVSFHIKDLVFLLLRNIHWLIICGVLGEHVLSQYVEGKEKEWDAYRTHVSQWEIERYIVMY